MTPETMREYVVKISSFRPLVVEGYVDGLYELAQFMRAEDLSIDFPPRGVITAAGTLFPHMRSAIEASFGAPVFDRYGSREAGPIASECSSHSGLHIMGETTIVEVVDEKGNEVPPGVEGEILVTNLWNYTMPLIRYRIGDRGTKSDTETCPCGRPYPLLRSISGRSSSGFLLKGGGVVSPVFFIHFVGVVHNDQSVAKFQVVQQDYDRILIRLVPRAAGFNLGKWPAKEYLVEHIKRVMGSDCSVEFRIDADIEKTPTGKHLYTVTHVRS
jgi:phenylacetate-CoA ligase